MKRLLMTRPEIMDECGLSKTEFALAVDAGMLPEYNGGGAGAKTRYFRADAERLRAEHGENLIRRTDVEAEFGVTRSDIEKAMEAGDLKPYDGPLQTRVLRFDRKVVEKWIKDGGTANEHE